MTSATSLKILGVVLAVLIVFMILKIVEIVWPFLLLGAGLLLVGYVVGIMTRKK